MDDAAAAPLASLSLTHVYYDADDHVSLLCAYLALLPQALCIVYASLIVATREAEIALLFAGQLACEGFNFALKRIIKEERPPRMPDQGYGMPSSHAQFVAFWSTSFALFLLLRHRPPKPAPGAPAALRPWSLPERLALSVVACGIAAAVAWSRIYLNYHTPRQVLVGCGAGVATAVAWFIATAIFRHTGWLGWALDTPLARAVRMRDLVVEEDMCQAGWEKWEAKRVAASRSKPRKPKVA